MNGSGYWERVMRQRLISRRAGLIGAASTGIGLVALGAGCGGNDSGGGGDEGESLLTKSVDTSKSAKPGGTYRSFVAADARGFDPHTNITSTSNDAVDRVYGRLTQFAPGLNGEFPNGTILPEHAESWEYTADRLQLTFKLRADAKLDARAPTNGRPVDAQDVIYSWQRIEKLHPNRNGLANSVSPDAPILSMQAPDNRTVVIKLAFEFPELLSDLSRGAQRFLILPREAEGGFDPRTDIRGSGPWIQSEYKPSSSLTYTKNPNWYRKDRPFVDKWEQPIVTEYTTRLAQFKAGAIYNGAIRLEDVLPTKRDLPQLLLYEDEWSTTVEPTIRFGLGSPDSPFWDQRVRQAFSMLIDRETWIRVFGAVDEFESAGLPIETRWMTHASVEGGVLPDEKEFGPNAKYYQLNIPEAKKLLSAAGYPNGFTTDVLYRSDGQAVFARYDALVGMLKEGGGLNINVKVVDRVNEFDRLVRRGRGDWNGFSFDVGAASPSIAAFLWRRYGSTGTVFAGFDRDGKDRLRGDPYINDITNKMVREADAQKRQTLIDDFVRYMADKMYEVPAGGQALGFRLVWPVIQNFGVFRAIIPAQESDIHLWLDPSKPPLGAS